MWVKVVLVNCYFVVMADYVKENNKYQQMSPREAVTNMSHFYLLTPEIVDLVHSQATCHPVLSPRTVDKPSSYNQAVEEAERAVERCKDKTLVSGTFKDIIVTEGGKLGIYGWNNGHGGYRQPIYTEHSDNYKDYSQGVRYMWPIKFCKVGNKWEVNWLNHVINRDKVSGKEQNEEN